MRGYKFVSTELTFVFEFIYLFYLGFWRAKVGETHALSMVKEFLLGKAKALYISVVVPGYCKAINWLLLRETYRHPPVYLEKNSWRKATQHNIELKPVTRLILQNTSKACSSSREIESTEIDCMIYIEVILPSKSEWIFLSCPSAEIERINALLYRIKTDKRGFKKYSYHLLWMDECIDSLGNDMVFSTLDEN